MIAHARARFEQELLKKKVAVPECPNELAHVWGWFCEVFNPGGVGMGPYRTEYREIQAYADMTHTYIKPSEARLIRRLCEVYMEIDAEGSNAPPKAPPGTKNLTSMSDAAGIKAIFANAGSSTPRSKSKPTAPQSK